MGKHVEKGWDGGCTETLQSKWCLVYSHLSPDFAGFLTVFINGVATEIPRGPLDIKAMFGQDAILVHSSGEPVLVNENGISLQSLQMGENYFLVSFFFPLN